MTPTPPSPASPRPYDDAELLAHMGWLRQLAAKLVQDPTLADDLAQQAWLAAKRSPGVWQTPSDMRAWLARVVQNLARSTARKEHRRKELEARLSDDPQHAPATDELVARAQLQAELARAVLELEEPHKSAILLRFLDDLSHEELGARLGISADAARKRVERALQVLRTHLDARHKHERTAWLGALVAFVDGPPPQTQPWTPNLSWPQLAGAAALLVAIAGLVPWMIGSGTTAPTLPTAPSVTSTGHNQAPAQPLTAPNDLGQSVGTGGGSSSLAVSAATSFWLREASGLPASGYSVLRHRDGAFEEALITDATGRITWPADARPTALLVWRDDYVLQRLNLPEPDAEQVAILPEGSLLAGVLTGIVPGRACHVRLTHDRVQEDVALLGVTGFVNAYTGSLETAPPTANGQMLALATDGSFRLRGLPAGWSGRLDLRAPYLWASAAPAASTTETALGTDAHTIGMGGATTLQVQAASADLRATVTSMPCVRGRLVEGVAQTPVSRGILSLQWDCKQSGGQMPLALSAEGEFWLPILPALRNCVDHAVRLSLPGRAWSRSLTVAELVDGHDLGVLTVPDATLWRLKVLDHEGQPLMGASVVVAEANESPLVWSQTSIGGYTEFLASPAAHSLVRVSHEGHLPNYVRTGPTISNAEPILVQLQRSAALVVSAVDASARELQGVVRVRAPMAADPARDWRDLGALDAEALEFERRWNAMQEMNVGHAGVLNSNRKPVHIDGVARGIPLVVELLDTTGSVRTAATTSIPSDTWTQAVQLVWGTNGYRISGFVRDATGAPISGALVELGRTRGEFMLFGVSDAEGRYELPTRSTVQADKALFVSKLGWAPMMTAARTFGPHDEQEDFVLQPSRPLRVHVVDAQQRPVQNTTVLARFPAPHGELCLVRELELGAHRTSDAPRVPGSLEVQLAGTTQTFTLPEAETEVPVSLTQLGALQVTVTPALASALMQVEVQIHAVGVTAPMALDAPCKLPRDGSVDPQLVHLPAGTWTVSLRSRSHLGAAWVTHGMSSTLDIAVGSDMPIQFQ